MDIDRSVAGQARDARFLASAEPDGLAAELGRLDLTEQPLLRAYWRARHLLLAAAPAEQPAILQAVALAEEPEADTTALAAAAGWTPAWSGVKPASALHRRLLGHAAPVRALAFGTVDRRVLLASADDGGTLRLWDPRDGTARPARDAHAGPVRALAFGRVEGRTMLATGGDDRAVRLWDPAGGGPERVITVPDSRPVALAFLTLPDGRDLLAVAAGFVPDDDPDDDGDDHGRVDLWNPATGGHVRELFHDYDAVQGVVTVPVAGRTALAAACGDDVRLWDPATGGLLGEWAGEDLLHDRMIRLGGPLGSTTIGGTTVLVAVGREDGVGWDAREFEETVVWWDPATGRQLGRRRLAWSVSALAVGADADRPTLLTVRPTEPGRADVQVSELAGRSVADLRAHTGWVAAGAVTTVAGAPVVATAATPAQGDADDHAVVVWHPTRGHRQSDDPAAGIAICRAGLVVGTGYPSADLCDPFTGTRTGRLYHDWSDEGDHIDRTGRCVAAGVVAGQDRVATGGEHGIAIWDPGTGRPVRVLRDLGHISALSFSTAQSFGATGLLAAGSSWAGRATVWDAATGARVAVLAEAPFLAASSVRSLAFGSAGGQPVVAAGGRSGAHLWDPLTGRHLRAFAGDHSSVAMAGPLLAVAAGRAVTLRDAATGERLATAANPEAPVTCVALAPVGGGIRLVTGDRAGLVRLWDAGTGERSTVLAAFARTVHAVAVGAGHVFAQAASGRVTASRLR